MKNTFCLLLFFLGLQLSAQQTKDSLFFREDQFYLDVNLILQSNDLDNFQQNGFSRSFHLGFLRDIPLSKSGKYSIALGLGYGFQRLVNSIDIEKEEGNYSFNLLERERSFRNLMTYHQLQLPFELRWRTATSNDFDFWRVYLGYRLSYQFGGRYDPFFGRSFSLQDQYVPWQHSLGLSFGYGSWNLNFSYEFVPVFKESIRTERGVRPKIYPVHIGLIFYFL